MGVSRYWVFATDAELQKHCAAITRINRQQEIDWANTMPGSATSTITARDPTGHRKDGHWRWSGAYASLYQCVTILDAGPGGLILISRLVERTRGLTVRVPPKATIERDPTTSELGDFERAEAAAISRDIKRINPRYKKLSSTERKRLRQDVMKHIRILEAVGVEPVTVGAALVDTLRSDLPQRWKDVLDSRDARAAKSL